MVELPRLPGSRENRWAHLLSGAPEITAPVQKAPAEMPADEVAALKADIARIEAELAAMQGVLARICSKLDIPTSP